MQFVADGPDIPDELLRAQEEGDLVLFCGAGISYSAKLPGFSGLVTDIYREIGTTYTPIEQGSSDRKQFDSVLDQLERRLPGSRKAVRQAVARVLKPQLDDPASTETHTALLRLATRRDETVRLITTNFDRIFEHVIARDSLRVHTHAAPRLPVPKNSRWDGLVYLHGLLPEDSTDERALNRLVLTSGDFGLAYLVERWASRFVSDLFRNYRVCFVGYSIDDPVLRYMMDALAADRTLGESLPQAYAFAPYGVDNESDIANEWKAKGVVPIPYSSTCGHGALHRTLKQWADIHRDGAFGKERIVIDYSMTVPSGSTREDDFVGRMLWALSDSSGLPAKRFADIVPPPSLEWLTPISNEVFRHVDLPRFNVPQHAHADEHLKFSLMRRPASYARAPKMGVVRSSHVDCEWDGVMMQLANWLVRYIDDPNLIFWLAQQGGQLHPRFARLVENKIDDICKLEKDANTAELEKLRAESPNGLLRDTLRPFWRLLLRGCVKSGENQWGLYEWKKRLERDCLTATLRLELRDLLAPKIRLTRPLGWPYSDLSITPAEALDELVSWELVLATDRLRPWLRSLESAEVWRSSLPMLLDDVHRLLKDALDLKAELGGASQHSDGSHLDLPSISSHPQNRGHQDWTVLIELLRDAWQAIHERDAQLAIKVAADWFAVPYPSFKRLALFAAASGSIPCSKWVDWLCADNAMCLWSTETKRELMRLLVSQGRNLTSADRDTLENAILQGPPNTTLEVSGNDGFDREIADEAVWLRLAKLASANSLGPDAQSRLSSLAAQHPNWELAPNETDEFLYWITSSWDADPENVRTKENTPRRRRALAKWLEMNPSARTGLAGDDWLSRCDKDFFRCLIALCDLSKTECWPTDRWDQAFQVWSRDEHVHRAWSCVAPLVERMPNDKLSDCAHSFSWWLDAVSSHIESHTDVFLSLCKRVLELPTQDGVQTDKPLLRAINHPAGHATRALLNYWFTTNPRDREGLRGELRALFTIVCEEVEDKFRNGRVVLAVNVIPLYRVDADWTRQYLLPHFDWTASSEEARGAWCGFLRSPRLHRPLLIELRSQFLATASHFDVLESEAGRQYAFFLTFVALEEIDTFSTEDLRSAFGVLPLAGLEHAAHALIYALEGAGEQVAEFWQNRIKPFWKRVWPKSEDMATPSVAEILARLCIAAKSEFPDAIDTFRNWLRPVEEIHFVIDALHDSGLPSKCPRESLLLLDAVVKDQAWPPSELGSCIDAIVEADPPLENDGRLRRLREYFRKGRD